MSTERPLSPPPTPHWSESSDQSIYPSPTSSSSNPGPKRRPSLKGSFSTKSTSIRENVQVMVRCRPRSKKEMAFDEEPCWLISPEEGSIELARLKSPLSLRTFNFDNVVMGVDNEQVYKAGILDLVRSAMMGYNGTVFAYGQTASGKTYANNGTETEPGVIPRAVQEVFSYIEENTTGREFLLRVSYMEIYNEKIKDLLNIHNTNPEIVEDKKGVRVRNLREVIVKTAQEVIGCIKEGEGNRHISATDYNEHSSRSHTIFQFVIESRSKGLPSNTNKGVRCSQLNLIDLAGSEKVATDVERRKEGGFINRSLLTLGSVISKLTSDEPSPHIPYRNSKLTRILQSALSGHARISVICTINPTFASKDESLNTLRFAQRTKLVKTAAKMTRIIDNSELQNCLLKIAELQTKMQEKNDLEAETRERLKSLLGLILTSTKDEHQDPSETSNYFSTISANDLMKESTMRDVVARCEEGFAAQIATHQKKIDSMTLHVEHMQDMLSIMESQQNKKDDVLSKKDAQIEKLKQELATAAAAAASITPPTRTTIIPSVRLKPAIKSTKTPKGTIASISRSIIPASKPLHKSKLFHLKEHEESDTALKAAQLEVSNAKVTEAAVPKKSKAVQHEDPEELQTDDLLSPEPKSPHEELEGTDAQESVISQLKDSEPPHEELEGIEAQESVISQLKDSEPPHEELEGTDAQESVISQLKESDVLQFRESDLPQPTESALLQPKETECLQPNEEELLNPEAAQAEEVSQSDELELEVLALDVSAPKVSESETKLKVEEAHIQKTSKSKDDACEFKVTNTLATATLPGSVAGEDVASFIKPHTAFDIPTHIISSSSAFISIQEAVTFIQPLYQTSNEIALVEETDTEFPELLEPELLEPALLAPDVQPEAFEPYHKSLLQPFPLSFLFNRWTIVCSIIYILIQTS